MFTGIVRQVGAVERVRPDAGGKRLTIDVGPLADGLAEGDSVAVSGACLTACTIDGCKVGFDVVGETLKRTTLGSLSAGSKVNLERSLRLTDALDGHLVQGHVDGVAEVKALRTAREHLVEFSAQEALTEQMVAKGSICIDGVSLTLVEVAPGAFSVALIPTTLHQTTLGGLAPGVKVNVETDLIGKYVRKYLSSLGRSDTGGGLTMEKLKDAGFL